MKQTKPYTDSSGARLAFAQHYQLMTIDELGNLEDRSEWPIVTWDGFSLVDADGDTWNEWLNTPEEIHKCDPPSDFC